MGIVYCARNKTNGKIYIGKTMKTLKWRREKHEGMAGSSKYHFHMALRKHGKDAFTWSILDTCDDEDVLSDLEREYIDLFSASISGVGYNKTHGGDGMSANFETRQKISKGNSGKVRTEEMNRRTSERQKARFAISPAPWFGKIRSQETRKRISETKIARRKEYEYVCMTCGMRFISNSQKSKYCSGSCKAKGYEMRRKQEAQA